MSFGFELERLIDAPPEEVFDAMTDPAAIKRWWTSDPSTVDAETDLRVGGQASVEWTGDEGDRCRAEQLFVEIDRPGRLVLTEVVREANSPTYECVLTFTFEAQDDKTRVTLVHTGFPTSEERDKHERGTAIFFDRLTQFVSVTDARVDPTRARRA